MSEPKPKRHRWGDKVEFAHKSERECLNGCGTTKVTRHETDGGRDVYWTEFWRGLDQLSIDHAPACEGPARSEASSREATAEQKVQA